MQVKLFVFKVKKNPINQMSQKFRAKTSQLLFSFKKIPPLPPLLHSYNKCWISLKSSLKFLGIYFSLIKDTITNNRNQNKKSATQDNSNSHPIDRTSDRFGSETENSKWSFFLNQTMNFVNLKKYFFFKILYFQLTFFYLECLDMIYHLI